MVQCVTITSLFKNSDTYDIYSDDFELSQKQRKRRKKLGFVVVGVVLVLVGVLLLFDPFRPTPKATYDRANDATLLELIEVSSAAARLPKTGQLFCWVQTAKIYHDTRALAINETWLKRCDHGQLFTSEPFNDTRIPYSTVFAGIPENYYNLFFKSRYAFHYIHEHISSEFEWYLKADDDTYVIVEHLREFLAKLNPDEPHFLGYVLKPYLTNGYNAGGAGYVLSRAALKTFNARLYSNASLCPDEIYEDVGIARCLASVGIFPEDTRNSQKQNRFNTFSPSDTFHQKKADTSWVVFPERPGYEAFASDLISFHKLTPDEIRLFDILLYRTRRPPPATAEPSRNESTSRSYSVPSTETQFEFVKAAKAS